MHLLQNAIGDLAISLLIPLLTDLEGGDQVPSYPDPRIGGNQAQHLPHV